MIKEDFRKLLKKLLENEYLLVTYTEASDHEIGLAIKLDENAGNKEISDE